MLTYGIHPTPYGPCLIVLSEKGLAFLGFTCERPDFAKRVLATNFSGEAARRDESATSVMAHRLFSADQASIPTLDLRGTPFQLQVWAALLTIPAGSATTYGALAAQIGHPKAARAVGSAVGDNPVAVVVPCHRVIRSDGRLGGYAYGTDIKSALLSREGALR